jgi:hypothetical protein
MRMAVVKGDGYFIVYMNARKGYPLPQVLRHKF